jgi:RHS repeat-associated protein
MANSSGAVTASNSSDSFGNPTNTGFSTRYQFTGREFDSFSGLQYSRARFYDPNLGRFISEDPIGFKGRDINWYSYVHNNPVMYFDPEGTQVRSDSRYQPYSPEDNRRMVQHVMSMPSPIQRLTRCQKGWLGKYFPDIDLDGINVHMGLPWYLPNPDNYAAHTGSRTDIYFNEKYYDPNSISTVGTAGHELTHVRQWRENGTLSFIPRYTWDLIKNGGYGPDIPFEKEAYDNGSNIRRDLEERNRNGERPCGCEGGLR